MEMSGVSGAPRLGGHLQLVDQEGRPFDSATLNKFMLVYFGFTHCPDICPEELDRMTEIIKSVEVEGQKLGVPSDMVVPVFVTIDPTRDGPAQMKEYLKGKWQDDNIRCPLFTDFFFFSLSFRFPSIFCGTKW